MKVLMKNVHKVDDYEALKLSKIDKNNIIYFYFDLKWRRFVEEITIGYNYLMNFFLKNGR